MPLGWVAAAGVAGSVIQAGAASDAANAQSQASQNAQNISQNEFNTITQQNAPFMQSGYGALSALDWGLGISPQTSTGAPVNASGNTAGGTAGYDPSSGYQIGTGGSISQLIPGGTNAPPRYTGNHGSSGPYGSVGQNGMNLGQTVGQPAVQSGTNLGGSGVPVTQGSTSGGQTGGLGFGSLTKSFDTSDWQQLSPAYNFQKQQGMQGVLNADASGQGALSGSAMKDLIDYNQNAANTSFNNAFNQYQTQQGNIFSRLSGIAGLGQSSANNTGQQGTTLAGQAAQSATNIGTAQAGGIVGSANAIAGGLSSSAPWLAYGSGSSNSNPANWDTENTSNFQDFASSDRRLKTDIRKVGAYPSGLAIYEFRFKSHPQQLQTGVMADEVELMHPAAVKVGLSGFRMVNYGMLH